MNINDISQIKWEDIRKQFPDLPDDEKTKTNLEKINNVLFDYVISLLL